MSLPIAAPRKYSDSNLQLYFPILKTSPVLIQAGDSYLSDLSLKDLDIKSIYMEKGAMEPNPDWSGDKYDWTSEITEIQSDFINSGFSNSNVYNLFRNSSLNDKDNWISIYEVKNEDISSAEHPSNWEYSPTPPSTTSKVWVNSSKEAIIPYIWNGTTWVDYYDTKQKGFEGSEVNIVPTTAGNMIKTKKIKEDGIVGIAQSFNLPTAIWDKQPITVGVDYKEEQKSSGGIIRLEAYSNKGALLYTEESPRIFNKNMDNPRNFYHTFKFKHSSLPATKIRISFYVSSDPRYGSGYFNKMMVHAGVGNVGYNLHRDEILLDLNAGEIPLPIVNGELDKSKYISEIAILRSVLGEGLLKWEEVTRLKSSSVQEAVLYDYFVENGNYYRYALQPILANGVKGAITPYYDVVSTFDGFWILGMEDLQFSFIYNGKIDSIEHIKPRDIVETIGGRYPYIIRSSEIEYRTFNFSGTLTHHQDVQENLVSQNYSTVISPEPTIPVGFVETKYGDEKSLCRNDLDAMQDGMVMQRLWRNKILKWLDDGKPKILKSEAQGNLLVFIDQIKVTPNETTFGLISDFSCRMTEIGSLSEKTLQKFKLRKETITKDELIKEAMKNSSMK